MVKKVKSRRVKDDKDFAEIMQATTAGPYTQYMEAKVDLLNKANSSDFEPSLDQPDALIQSLTIQ